MSKSHNRPLWRYCSWTTKHFFCTFGQSPVLQKPTNPFETRFFRWRFLLTVLKKVNPHRSCTPNRIVVERRFVLRYTPQRWSLALSKEVWAWGCFFADPWACGATYHSWWFPSKGLIGWGARLGQTYFAAAKTWISESIACLYFPNLFCFVNLFSTFQLKWKVRQTLFALWVCHPPSQLASAVCSVVFLCCRVWLLASQGRLFLWRFW